jgi:hypothetical protein
MMLASILALSLQLPMRSVVIFGVFLGLFSMCDGVVCVSLRCLWLWMDVSRASSRLLLLEDEGL